MQCSIQWNTLELDEWEARFRNISRSTLLQSYDYALAACPLYGQRVRWGLIMMDGREAGIVQLLEAGILWNALHAIIVDRGPLWFQGFGGIVHWKLFLEELSRQFPKRLGRKRRLIPEINDSAATQSLITQAGWIYQGPKYTTIWLDLSKPLESLRESLRKNWRGALNKAEKGPLEIVFDPSTKYLPDTVQAYVMDRKRRNYPGPEEKLVMALGAQSAARGNLLIGRALLDNRCVGSVLVLIHGSSATYQIGWVDEDGKKHGAHYRLLWSVLGILKDRGVLSFDLGGIHDEASGVSTFKDGLGGERITLSGLYI